MPDESTIVPPSAAEVLPDRELIELIGMATVTQGLALAAFLRGEKFPKKDAAADIHDTAAYLAQILHPEDFTPSPEAPE